MTLANSATAYTNEAFRGRVRAAVCTRALAVYQEPEDTPSAALRKSLARRVLSYPDTGLSLFLQVVTTWPAVADSPDALAVADNVIQGIVDAVWTRAAELV